MNIGESEQVRRGGLPPLSPGRGQAPLPDLFYSMVRYFLSAFAPLRENVIN